MSKVMEDGTHDIREHTDLEEVIRVIAFWDDHDSAISIWSRENGNILSWSDGVHAADNTEGQPTLLESLYESFPECWCRFAEWEQAQ